MVKKSRLVRKRIILPTILALSILYVGIISTKISADELSEYPPIVQKLAERFNLNAGDVWEVFDEERAEREAERYAVWADRLDEAVAEGKITDEQKQVVLDKHEEMHNKIQGLEGLSFEERREEMQKLHEEMRQWGEENELKIFWKFGGGNGKRHMRNNLMGPWMGSL